MAALGPLPRRSAAIRTSALARGGARPAAALPLVLALAWLVALLPATPAPAAPPAPAASGGYPAAAPVVPDAGAVYALFGQLPLGFVANAGQSHPDVHFQVRAPGHSLHFGDPRLALALPAQRPHA